MLVVVVIIMNYHFSFFFIFTAYLHCTSFLFLCKRIKYFSWNKHLIRFHSENPHSHIHTFSFRVYLQVKKKRAKAKRREREGWLSSPLYTGRGRERREKDERGCCALKIRLFCFVCVWWRINISWERQRRVINEMRRQTTDEVL